MVKVIAMQDAQLKTLNDNYINSVPMAINPVNTGEITNTDNLVSIVPQVDMESQIVNLTPQAPQTITNYNATNEVFGEQRDTIVNSFVEPAIQQNVVQPLNNPNVIPNLDNLVEEEKKVSENLISDDAYYELLNSLRNMITDFANNAYSAIDKFQEERLQNKKTGNC